MGKLIVWLVAGVAIAAISGLFPSVAVMVTAITIVLIFVGSKWFNE